MPTVHTAIRVDADDHETVKRLAAEHNLSVTRFLIDTALGRLPDRQNAAEQRLDELEDRIERLEQWQQLGH